jgi:hypothetical protein
LQSNITKDGACEIAKPSGPNASKIAAFLIEVTCFQYLQRRIRYCTLSTHHADLRTRNVEKPKKQRPLFHYLGDPQHCRKKNHSQYRTEEEKACHEARSSMPNSQKRRRKAKKLEETMPGICLRTRRRRKNACVCVSTARFLQPTAACQQGRPPPGRHVNGDRSPRRHRESNWGRRGLEGRRRQELYRGRPDLSPPR